MKLFNSLGPWLRSTAFLLLPCTPLACSSDDPGASRDPSSIGSGFGTNETWDVKLDDSDGTIVIQDYQVDFTFGATTAKATLDADDDLDLVVHTADGDRHYTGSRMGRTAGFALGASNLFVGGLWTLYDDPRNQTTNLQLSVNRDQVQALCLGGDCAHAGIEGSIAATSKQGSSTYDGPFLDAEGDYDLAVSIGPTSVAADQKGNFVLDDKSMKLVVEGDTIVDLTWNGSTMSGTAGGAEFAATKR